MQVHNSLQALPLFSNAVVTIGTFDGVHKGHQQVIEQLLQTAATVNGETVIITFHPHPRSVVGNYTGNVALLNTLAEKIYLLAKAGIHHLVIVPFTTAFANQTAEEYCSNFLFNYFKPHTVIIGYDHRFGKNRSGNYALLEQMGKQLGFTVKEINAHLLNSITISSTQIRKALQANDIYLANKLLGYTYFFEGIVVKGNQLGRTIGFATANIAITDTEKLIPANGVYAVTIRLKETFNKVYKGMMNIGLKPTIHGTTTTIEVHILHFNEDIYNQQIQIHIIQFLRTEQKFDGLKSLQIQLEKDKEKTIEVLSNI